MNILLVGAGYMGVEYGRILDNIRIPYTALTRSLETKNLFELKVNGRCEIGSIEDFDTSNFTHSIVCVDVDYLKEITSTLLTKGIKNILVEKPGALSVKDLEDLENLRISHKSNVFIGYNRRFYSSVIQLKRLLQEEMPTSMTFDFTEWSNEIKNLKKSILTKKYWILSNSSHVLDLVFYLCGNPKELLNISSGGLTWHPSGSLYVGCGITSKDVVFSYHANWDSSGRWSVEVNTSKNKFILRPIEKLQFVERDSVKVQEYDRIDYSLDEKFKPGLFIQLKKFIEQDWSDLCTIEEQIEKFKHYYKIGMYDE